MNRGRPSIYSEDILTKAREYLTSCGTHHVVKERPVVKDGMLQLAPETYVKEQVKLPSIEGLAVHLKISRETIYAWEKEEGKEDFSDILSELRMRQAETLINGSLSGEYPPIISKVLLTKHGYREGIDATTNDKDLPPSAAAVEDRVGKIFKPTTPDAQPRTP